MTSHLHSSFFNHIKNFVPSVSLDCVVFGYLDKKLHILLLKYKETDLWALPGGFLRKNIEMEEAISEVLYARTGLKNIFLTQFHTFSTLNRSWMHNQKDRKNFDIIKSKWPEEDQPHIERWFEQRFVSTAFMALLDASKVTPTPDDLSESCDWFHIDEIPELALDHKFIIDKARQHLRMQVNYLPIGKSLLKEKFTMADLQVLYEAILGKSLDRANFQRKMIKLGILIRHEKLMTGAQNKAPYLYSLNHKVYEQLIAEGIGFG